MSTIGPIPLLDGLQLMPADGKPTGLLRALNVEPRDSMVQTRRGCQIVAGFTATTGWTACFSHPATWNGQTVTYIGVDLGDQSDRIISIELTGTPAADEIVDEEVVAEFWGNDDAWHPISIINITNSITAAWWGPAKRAHLTFVQPLGWKSAQPAGTPSAHQWLRLTRTTAWVQAHAVAAQVRADTVSNVGARGLVLAPTTRAARGPYLIVPYVATGVKWAIVDMSVDLNGATGEALYIPESDACDHLARSALVAAYNSNDAPAAAAYIAASDKLLVSIARKYYTVNCGVVPGVGSAAEFAPNVPVTGPYGDIPLALTLPEGPAFIAVFGGRVFAGGYPAQPHRLDWSAPGEFWQIWPSENTDILADGGGGALLAGVALKESFYIFTTTAIWRATLGEPAEGTDSALFIDLVEETPCVSARSVVAAGDVICFLSEDGPRVFNGQRSKLVGAGVRDLFRPDSAHPLACLRKAEAVGVWHRVENQYRLAYPSSGASACETTVVVDLDDGTSWLWGADTTAVDDTASPASAYIAARPRGIRVQGWAWDPATQDIIAIDPESYVYRCDKGSTDLADKIRWYLESHNLGAAQRAQAVLTRVDAQVEVEHFQSFKVSAIPDGDRARTDTRTVSVQRSVSIDASVAIDGALLSAPITPLQIEASLMPVTARFRKRGRNHRVRLESAPTLHSPIKLLALTVDIEREGLAR